MNCLAVILTLATAIATPISTSALNDDIAKVKELLNSLVKHCFQRRDFNSLNDLQESADLSKRVLRLFKRDLLKVVDDEGVKLLETIEQSVKSEQISAILLQARVRAEIADGHTKRAITRITAADPTAQAELNFAAAEALWRTTKE